MPIRMPLLLVVLGVSLTACSDAGVTKFNTDPTAEISSHADGDTVREGYAETLRGTVGDANHAIDELTVSWLVDGVDVCLESAPDADGLVTCDHTFAATGGEVLLEVRDPEGGSGSARVMVDVQPTDAPEAEITAPTPDGVYYSDQLTTLEGAVSDEEDEVSALTVVWESSVDGALTGGFNEPDSEGGLLGAVTLSEGEHFLTLTVMDSTGKEGRDSTTIQVGPPNSRPTCAITAPASGDAGPEGELVTFTAEVDDVDVSADWLTVTWESDKDGALGESTPNSGGGVTFPYGDLTVDTHVVTMTVTDEVGATCAADVVYTVGTPPTLVVTSPSSGETVNEGASVPFTATVSDNEDLPNEVALSWSSDVDGEFSTQGADSTGAVAFSWSDLSAGDHALTVRATDTDGLYAQTTLDLTVNEVPTAPTVTLSPDPAYTANTLTASATGSTDPDGSGTVTYSYAWYVDGVASSVSTTATFPSSDTQKDSTYRVVVTPTDGTGFGPTGEAEVTVDNTAPVLTGPSLSASSVQVGDVLTCTASATDADAVDTPSVSYAWSDGSTGSTYTVSSADNPGDSITCTATADDGDGGTDTGTASATVDNTAPVMGTVTVSPSSGQVGDTLTCSASATDADGGTPTITYAWSGGSTGSTYTITSSDNPGDTLTCTATADDGDGGTDTGTATATVDNTAPVMGTVTISPSSANNDDTLTCSASATDADGGTPTITYAWSGSSAGSLGTGSSIDLSTTAVASAETVTCTATADDGYGGTDTGTATLTTANRNPTVSVTLSPSSGATRTDTLTCTATPSDDDGDSTTTTFSWTVDGASVSASSSSSLTSTLAGAFVAGNLVACTGTTIDGKGGTADDTASTTITNTAPTVSTPSLSPSTVYTNDTLTANVTTSDAEGDTLTVTYDWYVDGSSVQDGADNTLSGATWFDKDQDVYVIVTADDGTDTTTATSASVTVSNTPPTAPVVTIDPSDPIEGEDLYCEVTTASTDADGDAITYSMAWTVDGAAYSGALTNTWTDDTADGGDTAGGEEWECVATPNDGDDDGSTATDSVMIEAGCASIDLDGSNDYVTLGEPSSLSFVLGSTSSIELWVKPASYTGAILYNYGDFESSYDNESLSTNLTSSGLVSVKNRGPSGTVTLNSTSVLPLGEWSHIHVQREMGVGTRLYINGTLEASTGSTGGTLTFSRSQEWSLGARYKYDSSAYIGYYDGLIADFRVWSDVRTASEVSDAASGGTIDVATEPDLEGWWRFGEGSGTALSDMTGLASDGTAMDGSSAGATWVAECVDADADGDGYLAWEDCDDTDAGVYPFAGDTAGDGVDSDCDGIDCSAGFSGTTYYATCEAFTGASTVADARAYCTDAAYDGLATITNSTENSFIAGLEPNEYTMVGATDAASEGTWRWDSGLAFSFSNWRPGEPNNSNGGEDCLLVFGSTFAGGRAFQWNDGLCNPTGTYPTEGPKWVTCEIR